MAPIPPWDATAKTDTTAKFILAYHGKI